jgi:hypothetical protein
MENDKIKEKCDELLEEYLDKLATNSMEIEDVEKVIADYEEKQEFEYCSALKEAIKNYKAMEANEDIVESVGFSFDDFKILSVMGSDIYIKGYIVFEACFDDSEYDCVIIIDRDLFQKALNVWLDTKKDFCERYKHFCGVQGDIISNDYELVETTYHILDEEKLLNSDEDSGDFYKNVKGFRVKSFNEDIDMEHG